MSKVIGDVILDVQNISLRFGGVKALTDISFNVKEHEIRSIIGPNGAGKSSMLNCINGVYTPSEGSITFRGQQFDHMNSRQVAEMGIARTFQNLALFKGMSVIDNIMSGRNLKIKSNLLMQALRIGPAQREEFQHREAVGQPQTALDEFAVKDGLSHATTMGWSTLDGLIMGTRPGSLDPGLVLSLLTDEGMSPRQVETLLYKESGLLGLSGFSNDMRELLMSDAPRANEIVVAVAVTTGGRPLPRVGGLKVSEIKGEDGLR